jgi:hypothetical protein
MRFEVPQFIEIEDRIFGPLTWRQFVYLGGGVGLGAVLFLTMPFIIFLIAGLPLALLAAALSFYPVNNRPFSFFLEAIYNYLRKQRLYLWRRKEPTVYKQSFAPSTRTQAPLPVLNAPRVAHRSISSLARRLELQALQKKE